ncbi:hypothetical protein TYRP_015254 [Tyrophagus putrescentiae]|nr:hypothetical protein TYRP_015254 [Tyrophagus putrescentiae]
MDQRKRVPSQLAAFARQCSTMIQTRRSRVQVKREGKKRMATPLTTKTLYHKRRKVMYGGMSN